LFVFDSAQSPQIGVISRNLRITFDSFRQAQFHASRPRNWVDPGDTARREVSLIAF
jgi:hypothetical protein